jgi:hypothetical protein
MKRILMLVVLCVMLALPACNSEAVTSQQMQTAAQATQQYVQQVDLYQQAAEQLAAALKVTGVIDPNMLAAVQKIQSEIDRIQPQITQVAQAVQNAGYEVDDDTLTVLLKAAQAGNAASTPFNPYAIPIGAILSLLSIILGIFAAKKKAEADANAAAATQAQAKYQAHKQGVELTLKQAEADSEAKVKEVAALMYKNIGDARARNGVV